MRPRAFWPDLDFRPASGLAYSSVGAAVRPAEAKSSNCAKGLIAGRRSYVFQYLE